MSGLRIDILLEDKMYDAANIVVHVGGKEYNITAVTARALIDKLDAAATYSEEWSLWVGSLGCN